MKNLLKNILFFFILLFPYFASSEEPKISNYKKYKDTATQFRLEQLNVTLEHPWAISFIKDNQLIVTEKGGGLFTYNLDDGSKTAIKHKIPHIAYKPGGAQGGLLDVYHHPLDDNLYFTYSHDVDAIDKFPFETDANATDVGDLTASRQRPAGTQV